MNARKHVVALSATLLLASGAAFAHDKADQLGKVTFPTSCNAKAQPLFETGVAMLHSYWFGEARKTFDAALKEDPNCAMAYWGIALDHLGNSLAAAPSAKDAQAAWELLEKAVAIGAKTPRERDYIDSLRAYYRDHDKTPVNARMLAYTKATEQLTQRYPDDFEAWVFRAESAGVRIEKRSDVFQSVEVRRHPRKTADEESGTSRRHALPDPRL